MHEPTPITAAEVSPRSKPSNYPAPLAARMQGRVKQALGDEFGLNAFGVNRTTLKPGAVSALRHWHAVQDEFVYVLFGCPTLVTDAGESPLMPGQCVGFKGGVANGHHLVNRTAQDVVYLEICDRRAGDRVSYPDDDLHAELGADGQWQFQHKDGTPYAR